MTQDHPIRHVVWDWNGTLLDDSHLAIEATNASMRAAGHPAVTPESYRVQFVRPLQVFYERLLGRPVSEQETADLDAGFHVEYLKLVGQAVLRPDAIDALQLVADHEWSQSLLSMWPHDYLVPLVDKLELTAFFGRVDGNKVQGRAGKTDMLRQHLADLGFEPADVLMVGDTIDDAHSALEVGCRCVLIDSGHAAPGALEDTGQPVVTSLIDAVSRAATTGNTA